MRIYHLTDYDNITQFTLDYLDGGEHLNGPGVYFTSDHKDLDYNFYFNENENGTIYEVEIKKENYYNHNEKITEDFLELFMKDSKFRDIFIKNNIKEQFIGKDMLFFLKEFPFLLDSNVINLKEFCLKFVSLTKKEGMIIDFGKKRKDILILNPYDLKIINKIQPLLKKMEN